VGTGQKRRGMRWFGRSSAPDLDDTGAMAPRVVDGPAREAVPHMDARAGAANKLLFGDPDGPDGGSLSLVWVRFAANFPLPRHSHNSDCVYYVVSGELRMGNRVVTAGEGFFIPADAPYSYTAGPDGVEVLEFRGTSRFDIRLRETRAGWGRIIDEVSANRERWIDEIDLMAGSVASTAPA
jgi:quercetin dioxygenase-like cupin family protein